MTRAKATKKPLKGDKGAQGQEVYDCYQIVPVFLFWTDIYEVFDVNRMAE